MRAKVFTDEEATGKAWHTGAAVEFDLPGGQWLAQALEVMGESSRRRRVAGLVYCKPDLHWLITGARINSVLEDFADKSVVACILTFTRLLSFEQDRFVWIASDDGAAELFENPGCHVVGLEVLLNTRSLLNKAVAGRTVAVVRLGGSTAEDSGRKAPLQELSSMEFW